MHTEQEITKHWNLLFKDGIIDDKKLASAEELLDKLRLESPLRHRLGEELDELRKRQPLKA